MNRRDIVQRLRDVEDRRDRQPAGETLQPGRRGLARELSVEHPRELAAYLESGCKPREAWRIGTEHEKIGFYKDGHSPVPYEGPRGIRALLEGMQRLLGWEPIEDGDKIIQAIADNSVVPVLTLITTDNSICDPALGFNGTVARDVITDINAAGGDTYSFVWSSGNDMTSPIGVGNAADPTLTGRNGGFYTVTVENDRLGCISNPVITMPREVVVAVAWQGLQATAAPSGTACEPSGSAGGSRASPARTYSSRRSGRCRAGSARRSLRCAGRAP